MMGPPFYLVWHEDGGEPRHRHLDRDVATTEAERLARANPGERFFVLAPIESVVRSEIVRERYDPSRDLIPF